MNNGQNQLQTGNPAHKRQCTGPKCNMGREERKLKGSRYIL